ncbi:putative actin binding protein [Erysiphe neolycopersici]|uniref:Putative actin binding protein n=1 Tax=Erysiphe neolycopersici TaxID=212602 RepID=A0A420HFX4_9PEZI|nr:putative actin binding protein [Erysiphe neolycopersici]
MASLNTSTNGPSIKSSYQSVINESFGAGSDSPTFGIWAIFSVSTPLVNAFQPERKGKESILKVQDTGHGELQDLVEEFSEGRIQFAFVKIKDSNTQLPKNILIGWCGEGVPERTKGYFTSHLAVVSKIFHGYHVQITARSEGDLSPESIIKKVADASGAKYTRGNDLPPSSIPPTVTTKPAFTPSQYFKTGEFNPMASSRLRTSQNNSSVDEDGWGADAPQVTRTKLEKVAPAYKPTKVNMAELMKQSTSNTQTNGDAHSNNNDIIKGGYQPIGKVDIAAIRAQAHNNSDNRPEVVKGAYVPVGKVDIAAIRAKAQKPSRELSSSTGSHAKVDAIEHQPNIVSLADRAEAFTKSERLTALPKPKVVNNLGSTSSNFKGTRAPQPIGFTPTSYAPPIVGTASKTFADEDGKTPAQIWQEKKARERGSSITVSQTSPQNFRKSSISGDWKSGYTGKSWAPVSINPTGHSGTGSVSHQLTGDQEQESGLSPVGGINAIRSQFQGGHTSKSSIDTSPAKDDKHPQQTPIDTYTHPPQPDFPPPPRVRSPTVESPQRETSPPLVAIPIARTIEPEIKSSQDLEKNLLNETVHTPEHDQNANSRCYSPDHSAAATTQAEKIENSTLPAGKSNISSSGKCALILYDYEIAEDNEIQLIEGEYVTNIEMIDEDWWIGTNSKGENGLFPSNYVELAEEIPSDSTVHREEEPCITATALYDYEAAEDNELSFEEDAIITNVEFPDEDWWLGVYNGKSGLFPANYVRLNE